MSEKMMKKSRVLIAALLGTMMVAALTLWGCGGGGTSGYTTPVTTTKSNAIISEKELNQWIVEGKLNAPYGSADRVVVVTPTTKELYISSKHIPGAVLLDTATDLYDTRLEGLANVGSMVPKGTIMDTVVNKLGIDNKTTIVISLPKGSTDSSHYAQSRTFWTFRYWGFARERIKLLNGGDDSWDVTYPNTLTDIPYTPNPSGYSVKSNGKVKDVVRYSFNEIAKKIDELIADPTVLNNWQVVEARGDGTTLYMKNALRTYNTRPNESSADAMMFLPARVNGETTRNRLYPEKTELINLMASMPMDKDGERTQTFLSPTKKTVVMCGGAISASPSFVLFDAVLAVPEGNITMYDGSSSQWNTYTKTRLNYYNFTKKPAAMDQTTYDALIANWSFDQRVNGTFPVFEITSAPGVTPVIYIAGKTSDPTPFNTFNALTYTPALSDLDSNSIKSADKAYMLAPPPAPGGAAAGSSGGGC